MRECARRTAQTQPGLCWWEGGGGAPSARVSLVLARPPLMREALAYHIFKCFMTLAVCQALELPSTARGSRKSLNLSYTPVLRLSVARPAAWLSSLQRSGRLV